jgi:hypothetical protein
MAQVRINMETGEARTDDRMGSLNQQEPSQQQGVSSLHPMGRNGSSGDRARVTIGEEEMTSENLKGSFASSEGKVVDSRSILGTAQTISGSPAKALTEDCTVDLPDGFGKTSIGAAIYLGYIERDGNGGFREVPRNQQQAPVNPEAEAQAQETKAKQQAWKASPLDTQTVRAFDEFDLVYGEQFTDAVMSLAIDEVAQANETPDLSKFNQYASRARMEPQQFMEKVQRIVVGFEDQAQRYISKNHPGVNGKDVIRWMTSGVASADNVREILNRHIYQKDLKVYDNVVRSYLAHKDNE